MHSRFKALKGKAARLPALRPLRPDAQRQRRRRRKTRDNGGADSGAIATDRGHTCSSARTPSPPPTPPTATTRVPVHSALDADPGFLEVSNGFAGQASDGLNQLDAAHAPHHRRSRTPRAATSSRPPGRPRPRRRLHARARLRRHPAGPSARRARRSASASAASSATTSRAGSATTRKLVSPRRPHGVSRSRWSSLLDEYYLSAFYVKAAEDKTFRGAVAAALASPWGQSLSAGSSSRNYFGSYREIFAPRPLRGVDLAVPRRRPRAPRAP